MAKRRRGISLGVFGLSVAGSRSGVRMTPAGVAPEPEPEAIGHWVLGDDNAGQVDLVSGQVLTPLGGAPALASGYLTVTGSLQGLQSPIDETADMTLCMVIRSPAAGAAGALFGGTLGAVGSVGGVSAYIQSANTALSVNQRGWPGAVALEAVRPDNQWVFIAIALNAAGDRILFRGDPAASIVLTGNATRIVSDPVRKIGVGDCYYNSASFAGASDVAELIVFDQALTAAQIAAVYASSKALLNGRVAVL